MKIVIVQAAIMLFQGLLSLIYAVLKIFPVKPGKVLFCSRQSDEIPLDFLLLKNHLKEKKTDIEVIFICNRISRDVRGCISFFGSLLKSMYHLATSSVCIIDSYWPAVSMLTHKKSLKVIQIWHSIGKMKKSGYQALDRKSGRKSEYADLLKMHKNYDYLVGGSKFWNDDYCEAFGVDENQILNYGLPRIDYLIDSQEENKRRFYAEFPELREKKVVLYAPTFRKNMKSEWANIMSAGTYDDIEIIVKNHPGQNAEKISTNTGVRYIDSWDTIDLLTVCDYLITDYSSIAFEAAVIRTKTYFWTYDYDEYMRNSGINIDLKNEMSGNLFKNLEELMQAIEYDRYNYEQQEAYIDKYLMDDIGYSTELITDFVINLIREEESKHEVCYHGRWKSNAMEETSRST